MLRKGFKKFNLFVIIINIIMTNCCFAFDEVKVSTTRISEKIVDTSRRLRAAKEDKARHERMEMAFLVNMDNRIIADLEEKKVALEEELFLLLSMKNQDNQCYDSNKIKKQLTLSKKLVDTSRRLRAAKEDKARHESMRMAVLMDIDNRIIADLEEKKVTLEEELFLLNPDVINHLKKTFKN